VGSILDSSRGYSFGSVAGDCGVVANIVAAGVEPYEELAYFALIVELVDVG